MPRYETPPGEVRAKLFNQRAATSDHQQQDDSLTMDPKQEMKLFGISQEHQDEY